MFAVGSRFKESDHLLSLLGILYSTVAAITLSGAILPGSRKKSSKVVADHTMPGLVRSPRKPGLALRPCGFSTTDAAPIWAVLAACTRAAANHFRRKRALSLFMSSTPTVIESIRRSSKLLNRQPPATAKRSRPRQIDLRVCRIEMPPEHVLYIPLARVQE